MGWYDYYKLLEKYDGDLKAASKEEMDFCARANPNTPMAAARIAMREYYAERVIEIASELTSDEYQILDMRFGINGEAHTLEQTAQKFKITREQVRQTEAVALEKINDLNIKKRSNES